MWKENSVSSDLFQFSVVQHLLKPHTHLLGFPTNVPGPKKGDKWKCSPPALSRHPISHRRQISTLIILQDSKPPLPCWESWPDPCLPPLCPHRQHLRWPVHMNSLPTQECHAHRFMIAIMVQSMPLVTPHYLEIQQNAYHMLTAPPKMITERILPESIGEYRNEYMNDHNMSHAAMKEYLKYCWGHRTRCLFCPSGQWQVFGTQHLRRFWRLSRTY